MGAFKDLTGKKFNRLKVLYQAENRNNNVSWICLCDCGNVITVSSHDVRNGHTKSCGCLHKEIVSKMRKNKKRSEVIRRKISKTLTGRKLSRDHKINISKSCIGRKVSEETKKKISIANEGKKLSKETKRKIGKASLGRNHSKESIYRMAMALTGSGNGRWKGGIACEPYCDVWLDKEFKEGIKDRDGRKCQNPDCWGNCKKLHIHHIDYDKKNCHPNNLITLCISCNTRVNSNRNYWENLYKEAMQFGRQEAMMVIKG